MSNAALVAIDWGTSSFRLWVLDEAGKTVASVVRPCGMQRLQREDYERILLEMLTEHEIGEGVPVIICGMAGAAQGWHEAAYLSVPARGNQLSGQAVTAPDVSRTVRILPGVGLREPANVMRGEETQIAGLLQIHPAFEGTVCLPGTHTKWVRVNGQAIHEFETCMTGELFACLCEHSILAHSVAGGGWSASAFLLSVKTATGDPCSIARRLFSIRANMLVDHQGSDEAIASLSGFLIGQELMSVSNYWKEQPVALIGAQALCELYQKALSVVGVQATMFDSEKMTLNGFWRLTSKKRSDSDQKHHSNLAWHSSGRGGGDRRHIDRSGHQ